MNNNTLVPACYYPTTLVMIDDDPDWLDVLKSNLRAMGPCKTFDHPVIANEALLAKQWDSFANRRYDSARLTARPRYASTLDALKAEMSNSARLCDIATVIIDYQMPRINGLDICRNIKHINIKKVLLTAEATDYMALNAFNEGLIDTYLPKGAENLSEILTKTLYDLQMAYFIEHSQSVFDRLQQYDGLTLANAIFDAEFSTFFKHFIKENNIRELYFYDAPGDYVLIDEHQKFSWLQIRNTLEEFPKGINPQTVKTIDHHKFYFIWHTEQPENFTMPEKVILAD